jgi:hypothetical protein
MGNQQVSNYNKRIQHGGNINHPEFPHNKFRGYRAGCRCEGCINAHREYKRKYNKILKENNPVYAENQREDKRKYRKSEKGKGISYSMVALHRQRKYQQTPENCNHDLLRLIYDNSPKDYHVDHILPLSKGGLHEPNNLQYLPAKINLQKNNSLNFNYEIYAIRWQDIIVETSTTIERIS